MEGRVITHIAPGLGGSDGKWHEVNVCKDCFARGYRGDLFFYSPCPECGGPKENYRRETGRWIPKEKRWELRGESKKVEQTPALDDYKNPASDKFDPLRWAKERLGIRT